MAGRRVKVGDEELRRELLPFVREYARLVGEVLSAANLGLQSTRMLEEGVRQNFLQPADFVRVSRVMLRTGERLTLALASLKAYRERGGADYARRLESLIGGDEGDEQKQKRTYPRAAARAAR